MPPGVATVTSTRPGVPAGAVAVMVVALFTVNVAAGLPDPKSTTLAPVKLVPLRVTREPDGPVLGLTPVTVGAGGGRYV